MVAQPEITVAGYAGTPGNMQPVYHVQMGVARYKREPSGKWFKERDSARNGRGYRTDIKNKYMKIKSVSECRALEQLITRRIQSGINDSYKE